MLYDVLILALFVAVPFVALWVCGYALRRWHRHDPDIDALIHLNTAKPRLGMETIDWQKSNRSGERAWHRQLRAQRRWSTVVTPVAKGQEGRVN